MVLYFMMFVILFDSLNLLYQANLDDNNSDGDSALYLAAIKDNKSIVNQ